MAHRQGFTLIEISIVLIIIGLLVGGIFVGTDLYDAAKARKTISEYQEFQVAASTFRVRYNCLPGDCRNYERFGGATRSRGAEQGDGDWSIESHQSRFGGNYHYKQCGENLMFWADLFDAGIINSTSSAAEMTPCINITPETGLASYLPKTLWGADVFWVIGRDIADNRKHHLFLVQINSLNSNGRITPSTHSPIPAALSKQMDEKIDDGEPLTGSITIGRMNSAGGGGGMNMWNSTNYECRTNATPSEYDLAGDGCSLRFEVKF